MKFLTGIISDVDPARALVRVTIEEDEIVTDWLPILFRGTTTDKDYFLFEKGQQVRILLDKNCEDGVVLGATYNAEDVVEGTTGPGVRSTVLTKGGAPVFSLVIEREADGKTTLTTKGGLSGTTETGDLSLESGAAAVFKAAQAITVASAQAGVKIEALQAVEIKSGLPVKITGTNESAGKVLADFFNMFATHQHVVNVGAATTVTLDPATIANFALILARLQLALAS